MTKSLAKSPVSMRRQLVSKRPVPPRQPTTEIAPVGAHPTDPDRDAHGRFINGNDGRTETEVYSAKQWARNAPLLLAQRDEVLSSKGFTEQDVDPVFSGVADAYVQALTIMNHYFDYLAEVGAVSPKGRTRRAVEGWSRAADRVAKFAAMLGLERRTKRVSQTPMEWLDSLPTKQERHDEQNTITTTAANMHDPR